MLLHRLQPFPNFKLALAQRLLETHSFQGPDISFVHQLEAIVMF